jgi:hypothetical protein
MVTHIPFPTAYHIGKEGNIRESEIYEERHIILKLVMIGARGFLAKFFLGALVVFTPQPKFVHVFNTLLEGSCLLAYSSLPDVAVKITCYHRWHLFDMLRVSLQAFQ